MTMESDSKDNRDEHLALDIVGNNTNGASDPPLMTPPARENTEIEDNSLSFRLDTTLGETLGAISGISGISGITGITELLNEIQDDLHDDVDLNRSDSKISELDDKDKVLAALEQLLSENDIQPAELLAELERLREYNGRTNVTEGRLSDLFGPDTYAGNDVDDSDSDEIRAANTVTPTEELGLGTKTMSELNFTWNSSFRRSDLSSRTALTTAYTNQYLSTLSTTAGSPANSHEKRGSTVKFGENHKAKAGVRWNSRVETMSPEKPYFYRDIADDEEDEDNFDSYERELQFSRNASRLALESREAMFRRAMTLLSARCNSTKQSDIDSELPFGIQVPKFFYVTQEKPVPMEPLKAWRGYNGNIYFQPISVNHLETNQEEMIRARTSVPRTRNQQRARTTKSLQRIAEKENQPIDSRSDSRQTTKSSVMSKRSTNRQMAVLDKHSVFNNLNEAIHEDIVWLEGQENTGSLAVRPKTYPDRTKEKERDLQYNKERIRKGSVVHKLYVEKGKGKPKFAVSGGKFTPPNSMSPLLRTQTQYSLSHRLTTNSPDPYHLNESKLPPLDQIRASIKHMDTKQNTSVPRGKSYTRSVTLTDDMKPFVKYSPDVVAKFTKQANIC